MTVIAVWVDLDAIGDFPGAGAGRPIWPSRGMACTGDGMARLNVPRPARRRATSRSSYGSGEQGQPLTDVVAAERATLFVFAAGNGESTKRLRCAGLTSGTLRTRPVVASAPRRR